MTSETEKKEFELTGKHVLAIMVTAFSIIIGVNVFMAYSAIGTFPGLETKNSYVSSQKFDAQKAAQLGLGWNVSAHIEGAQLVLDIKDTSGQPVEVASLYGLFGRATHVKEDQEPEFVQNPDGTYVAQVGTLGAGNWNLRLNAVAQNGTSFQQRIPIYVK
ncbi:FixH family protein [Aliiroseovarius sp. 2305UL8-7]|uniref:FixH family protein n=1 Tax=Aliiroseovarius conchicola TaxID=3121637 RepID=UPI0035272D06